MLVAIGEHNTLTLPATAYTLTKPAGATHVAMQVTVQNAKYRVNGTSPTAMSGFTLYSTGDERLMEVVGDIIVIRVASGAILDWQWFGR